MDSTGSILATAVAFIGWFILFFLYHGLGITLGYHRLLTHKSLKVPKWLLYWIVSGGYLSLMGGPINWVGVHRLHHQKSDTHEDPHSPMGGFKHSLYEWMFSMGDRQSVEELHRQVPDLLEDKVLRMFGTDHSSDQAMLCLSCCILFRCVLFLAFGWVAVIANLVATFVVFWSPQLVNSICHMQDHGYRLFETRDRSRNVWWVAMLSLGEGWHNNHHAMPKSVRHGMAWWEFDLTYATVCLLEKLGLAWDIVRPTKEPKSFKINQRKPLTPLDDEVEEKKEKEESKEKEAIAVGAAAE